MGCNCGGGSPRSFLATTQGTSAWAAAANRPRDNVVWVVTHPDGTISEYDSDSQAYRAIAKTGGGVKSEIRALSNPSG